MPAKDRIYPARSQDPLWLLATVVSRAFDPIITLTTITLLGAATAGLSQTALVRFSLVFVFLMITPLVVMFYWKLRSGSISNWDISLRRERLKPLLYMIGLLIVNELIVRSFGNARLNSLFVLYILWAIGFFAITAFWKISGHSGVNTLGVLLVIRWLGWSWWPIIVIPVIVSWARLYRKDHSLGQLIAGIAYSWIVVQLLPIQ